MSFATLESPSARGGSTSSGGHVAARQPATFDEAKARAMAEEFPHPTIYLGLSGGVATGRVIDEQLRTSQRGSHQYSPPALIVEPQIELTSAAARGEFGPTLRDSIASGRVRCASGSGWCQELTSLLSARDPLLDTGWRMVNSLGDSPIAEHTARIIQSRLAERDRQAKLILPRVRAIYAGRTPKRLAERIRAALHYTPGAAAPGGTDGPLRLMVCSCRFSTFIRHSAEDLASAAGRAGWDTHLLIEPDDYTALTGAAMLRAVETFRPDVCVSFNWPRGALEPGLPIELPVVTWIQDAMQIQFDERVGRGQGRHDALIGYLFRELFERFEYPRRRAFAIPVVADSCKFHPASVGSEHRSRHECQIACVTHHSETPDRLHARLRDALAGDPGIGQVLDRLRPRVLHIAERADTLQLHASLHAAVEEETSAVFGAESLKGEMSRGVMTLQKKYALPLADRILRQQMLGWAADLSMRRGWRLRIYGKGWADHPTLGPFAAGEVEHGEDLRAAYQCAAVHLHASASVTVHQRALECFLSGGVCLIRMNRDAISGPRLTLRRTLFRRTPDVTDEHGNRGYDPDRHPEIVRFEALLRFLGLPSGLTDGRAWLPRSKFGAYDGSDLWLCDEQDPDFVFGDLRQIAFTNATQMEACVVRAVEDPDWRRQRSAQSRERVLRRLTYDAVVRRLAAAMPEWIGGSA